ncbi:fumarylacetoacetate hydrolase family protein [Devosia lacusdianchii]|uniref:fumarylacetoacetate hydrolase family protein n=1 Tax=Devosia lacusdianchii TaxID=2917991 RepID=UPI001F0577A1|nr:fumarylacetoacetate hydrolase family protein [Devosia sp. JXJ CY 41]
MRLCSFIRNDRAGYGALVDNRIADISAVLGSNYPTLAELIAHSQFLEIATRAIDDAQLVAMSDLQLLPVIPAPRKIICVGLNYQDHLAETKHAPTQLPPLFSRFADSQCAHGEPIILPSVSEQLDFEAELAVVIGKAGRHVESDAALGHIAGYSCYNDGSIRDWQTHSSQFLPGKNFPRTGAFGPFLVTADEIADPQDLEIACRLNGETVQSASTSQMIHSVASLISYISRITPLGAGDVIVTGTPGGVGFTRVPPLFMKAGDVVEVVIEHVGTLRNYVAPETTLSGRAQ